MKQKLYIVLPCFNESLGISFFFDDLKRNIFEIEKKYNLRTFVIMVDDGSMDGTWEQLSSLNPQGVGLATLRFSRNFGHQMAIYAGLNYVDSKFQIAPDDTIIMMDSDGQHPPACLIQLIESRNEGFHHVQMLRTSTEKETLFKKITSRIFYMLFRNMCGIDMPEGAADFRAISGQMLKSYISIKESGRFNRGLFYWLGYKTKFINYTAVKRNYGTTSYTLTRMLKLAFNGVTYFSSAPLTIFLTFFSSVGILLSVLYFLFEIVRYFNGLKFQPGWMTIIAFISFWSGIICLGQLITGIYLSRVFNETKKRPSYIIMDEKLINP